MLTPEAYFEAQQHVTMPCVDGLTKYYSPVGSCFKDGTTLELDRGFGFVPQVLGVGYQLVARKDIPATVADLKIGWELIGNNTPVSAAWSMRFSWPFRKLSVPPPVPMKVFTEGGEVSFSPKWLQSVGGQAPNAVLFTTLDGYQIELHRYARKRGGGNDTYKRLGKRFVPYYRMAVDMWLVEWSTLGRGQRQLFKACYVDPASGARSALSAETIVFNGQNREDKNHAGVRAAGSVWIDR